MKEEKLSDFILQLKTLFALDLSNECIVNDNFLLLSLPNKTKIKLEIKEI